MLEERQFAIYARVFQTQAHSPITFIPSASARMASKRKRIIEDKNMAQ
jgi:hypothetical protein